jgi:hypothetical protein
MNIRSRILLVILLLLAGCSSTGRGTVATENSDASGEFSNAPSGTSGAAGATASGGARGSGFLGDYSQLKPAPDREGVMLYMDRSRDLRAYNKVMFDPVQVYATPGPDAAQLAPDVQQRLGSDILNSLRASLEPKYQVVTTPGPDVFRIRTAITGIQAVKPDMRARDFMPIIAVYNLAASKQVAEMQAEIEVLDAQGKRVAAATVTRKGDEKLPQGSKVTWSQLSAIGKYWGNNLRMRLDELRGEPAKVGAL